MEIYNTLTKQKEVFSPRVEKKVKMFVCGPTVYDYIHIGNARTFVFFDVLAKYLRFMGYDVDYIQNITDLDDKIINKAETEDKTWKEIADFYFDEFKKDAFGLGIDSPRYLRATDYIDAVEKQVKTLKAKDFAYLIENDGWYFDLAKFPQYGALSGRSAQVTDDAVSRIDDSVRKRSPGDFCLWKLTKEGEGWYDNELNNGRPGWHIEDTAITESEFGPQYDIHGGGQDLIFPHHEAEIAQQMVAADLKEPADFVRYWIHTGFLVNKDQKMSKSLGNFSTVRELLANYPKETLRFYFLSAHYRSPLDFTEAGLKGAQAAIQRIADLIKKLKLAHGPEDNSVQELLSKTKARYYTYLDKDLNASGATAEIFQFTREVNPFAVANKISAVDSADILNFLEEVHSVLGIIPPEEQKIPTNVEELAERREKYRIAKEWQRADEMRAEIEKLGYEVEDTIYGPLIKKI